MSYAIIAFGISDVIRIRYMLQRIAWLEVLQKAFVWQKN